LGLIIFSADESDAIKPPSKDAPDPLCPHCLTSIGPFEHFCRQCDGPITCHAATDPIGQIFSLGHLCRRATTSCTRLSTLIGMWLIFGSGLITLIFYPVISLENEESFAFFFLLLISILIPLLVAVIHIAILWQVTHRYIEHRKSRAT
jgi:hypothetical protein